MTERTDRNGRVRQFDYDPLNRPTEERWLEGAATVNTINFAYDAASQLTAASDAVSAYAYEYNNLGLITQVDNWGTSVGPHAILDYTFDALGNKTSLVATIDGVADLQNTYSYDDLSRMTSVQQTHSDPLATGVLPVSDKRVDFSYDALGQFTSIDRYADLAATELVVSSDYIYDSASRLTALDHAQGATTLAAYTWTFDDLGRITQATSPDGTSDYTYDATGQLTGATNSFAADENYSYDENGNRTMSGYVVGTNNQILSDGTYDYEYDAEGNRTKETNIATGEVTEYDYDHHNRLTRITGRTSDTGPVTKQVDYTYDLFGRRLAKHIDNDGDGTVDEEDFYIYDGQRHERGNAGDHIILAFEDPDGRSGSEPATLTNRYLHGPAVDQVLADEQLVAELIDEILYPLTDQLGSVRDLAVYDEITGDTTISNHIVYDSFGQILSESNAAIDHLFAYTGRERDEESDLQYNRARYYHLATGTWMSADPLGFAAGDFNLGRYSSNAPTGNTDPSGLVIKSTQPIDDILNKYSVRFERTQKDNYFYYGKPAPQQDSEVSILTGGVDEIYKSAFLSRLVNDPETTILVSGRKEEALAELEEYLNEFVTRRKEAKKSNIARSNIHCEVGTTNRVTVDIPFRDPRNETSKEVLFDDHHVLTGTVASVLASGASIDATYRSRLVDIDFSAFPFANVDVSGADYLKVTVSAKVDARIQFYGAGKWTTVPFKGTKGTGGALKQHDLKLSEDQTSGVAGLSLSGRFAGPIAIAPAEVYVTDGGAREIHGKQNWPKNPKVGDFRVEFYARDGWLQLEAFCK